MSKFKVRTTILDCQTLTYIPCKDAFRPVGDIYIAYYKTQSNVDVFLFKGSKVDLKITFAPDHTSELYADTMRITMISNEKNSKVIQLHGKSRVNNMYVRGVEQLSGNLNNESMILIDLDVAEDQEDDSSKEKSTKGEKSASKGKTASEQPLVIPNSALVTLYSSPSTKTFGEYNQAEKLIHIGCMKSNSDKKDVKKVIHSIIRSLKSLKLTLFRR